MARARRARGVVLAAAACLCAAELAARLATGRPFDLENAVARRARLAENNCAADWDADLGWAPKPEKSGRENLWGTTVTILDDGTRKTGDARVDDKSPILAVGDSYTFGDEVSDEDAWPARLQALTGRRVVNGGVCAYGADQAFMRLEKFFPVVKPKTVVFGLIDLSITRTEAGAYPTPVGPKLKPYFKHVGPNLRAEGRPIPRLESSLSLSPPQRVGGYSRLVDAAMTRLAPRRWAPGPVGGAALTGEDGLTITCALLAALPSAARGAKAIALLQHHAWEGPDSRRRLEQAKACARAAGLRVVDVGEMPSSLFLPGGHLSPEGNRRVAEALARAL